MILQHLYTDVVMNESKHANKVFGCYLLKANMRQLTLEILLNFSSQSSDVRFWNTHRKLYNRSHTLQIKTEKNLSSCKLGFFIKKTGAIGLESHIRYYENMGLIRI